MAAQPIEDIIEWMKISAYLAEADQAKTKVFKGSVLSPNFPLLLRIEADTLDFMYGFNPNHADIDAVANYGYHLCGKYLNEAKVIQQSGGSGGIVNPGEGTFVVGSKVLAEWTVGDVGYPGDGDDSYSNEELQNLPTNRLVVFRNTFTQFHSDKGDGDSYILKNTEDDFFTFIPALTLGEKIQVVILSVLVEDGTPIPPTEGSSSFTGDID